jgi:hypothetical protein
MGNSVSPPGTGSTPCSRSPRTRLTRAVLPIPPRPTTLTKRTLASTKWSQRARISRSRSLKVWVTSNGRTLTTRWRLRISRSLLSAWSRLARSRSISASSNAWPKTLGQTLTSTSVGMRKAALTSGRVSAATVMPATPSSSLSQTGPPLKPGCTK